MPQLPPLHLVSEARPLRAGELSEGEKALLESVHAWVGEVVADGEKGKKRDRDIDEHRTGRVLFIDGPRGAGKTSILLTMLEHWEHRDCPQQEPKEIYLQPIRGFHVLFPVLDFDPLPQDMPLHGWLLEPWRRYLDRLAERPATESRRTTDEDLREMFLDLSERAIQGWTAARPEDGGAVQKALAYQDQASGWLDTPKKWTKFVDAVVCRLANCTREKCVGDHKCLFVIAIDDVDLQVEQIPRLLHAIRLLHHPHVLYMLTGNYAHTSFLVGLDYEARHVGLWRPNHREVSDPESKITLQDIRRHSDYLRDAILQKSIPLHAQRTLPLLTLDDVARLDAKGKVLERLSAEMQTVWSSKEKESAQSDAKSNSPQSGTAFESAARALPFVTARRAQHAIDRHLKGDDAAANSIEFLADLCQTKAAKEEGATKEHFEIRGRLTTRRGPVLRKWPGDALRVRLSRLPEFVFEAVDSESKPPLTGDLAHGAVIAQLLVEHNFLAEGDLNWNPEVGILSTDVDGPPDIRTPLVFHWPWLVRLNVRQVFGLDGLARALSDLAQHGYTAELNEKFIVRWLWSNIDWARDYKWSGETPSFKAVPRYDSGNTEKTIKYFGEALRSLHDANQKNPKFMEELKLWAYQLYVMTVPYYGLQGKVAHALRHSVQFLVGYDKKGMDEVAKWQRDAIGNAFYDGGITNQNSNERKEAVEEFHRQRQGRLDEDERTLWISLDGTSTREPEPTSKA